MVSPVLDPASEAADPHGHESHHGPTSIWTRYVFSQDHKVIGIQYILTAAFMAVVAVFRLAVP